MSRYANVLAWSLILGFFSGPALGLSGPDLSKTRDLLFAVACVSPFVTACYVLLRVDIASHRGWIRFPLLLSWLMVPAWAGLFLYLDANDIWGGDSVRETVLRLSAFAVPIVLFFLARRQASKREPLQPLPPRS